MTIFHVIKYPLPDNPTAGLDFTLALPIELREIFVARANAILDLDIVSIHSDDFIDVVFAEYRRAFICVLMEYEE